jgi:hypothetical protein
LDELPFLFVLIFSLLASHSAIDVFFLNAWFHDGLYYQVFGWFRGLLSYTSMLESNFVTQTFLVTLVVSNHWAIPFLFFYSWFCVRDMVLHLPSAL